MSSPYSSSNSFWDILLTSLKCPNFQRAIILENKVNFFFYFNQVIYSSSHISWPNFNPLAQILFEISCWQDFILIFSKGVTPERVITWTRKIYGSAFFPWESIWNFKTLACTVLDERMDACTTQNQYAASTSKSWGHKKGTTSYCFVHFLSEYFSDLGFMTRQDYFTHFEQSQWVGGAKMGDPQGKPPDHQQAEPGLSQVTQARLKPTVVRWRVI